VCLKDGNGDLLEDSHSISNRRKNHFSNLMYVILMKLGRFKLHTAEPLVPAPGAFESEMVVEKRKSY
jgi:hypothetical protein